MSITIADQGRYELFETPHHHRILRLNNDKLFALIRGQQGDMLVHSEREHERERTIQEGQFYLVDFDQDPKFRDIPHLFLEANGKYEEWVLPNGLPTKADPQKRVVFTDETLSKRELEEYLGHPPSMGRGVPSRAGRR